MFPHDSASGGRGRQRQEMRNRCGPAMGIFVPMLNFRSWGVALSGAGFRDGKMKDAICQSDNQGGNGHINH